jgi:hypothetical protein
MPPHEKKPRPKDITKVAIDFATSAMASPAWAQIKPEELATYCITAATKIIDHEIDEED